MTVEVDDEDIELERGMWNQLCAETREPNQFMISTETIIESRSSVMAARRSVNERVDSSSYLIQAN
jgi:hypothetical protein